MVEKELQNQMQGAKVDRLSNEKAKILNTIIHKHIPIFKIQLVSGNSAKVTPMKIALDDSKNPVKVKDRRYPTDQNKFLDAFFEELASMGFLKPRP